MLIPQKKARLLHLDFMRGIFLCVIIVDHLQKFPGFFDLFTGRGILWASAAEGFFFLSGILLGLVRGRREVQKPMRSILRKIWSRAFLLYLWSIALTLFFTLLALVFLNQAGVKPGYNIPSSVASLVRETLTFHYVYGWADFLQYYAIFIFFSPLAIWLLRKHWWWVVLLISVIVWVIGGQNFYMSWQLLFFSGVVFGYYVDDLHTRYRKLSVATQKRLRFITVGAAIITFIASYILVLGSIFIKNHPSISWHYLIPTNAILELNEKLAPGFDKTSLGIGRIIIFYIWFFAMYFMVKHFAWLYERSRVGAAITGLGQNSLYVYIVHSVILFGLGILLSSSYGFFWNTLIDLGVIMVLIMLVRYRIFFSYIPR